LEFFNAESYQA